MNQFIILEIAKNLNIKEKQVEVVLSLLSEGNTVPFIARYRKEATGALDEETIRSINEVYEYQMNLLKRKEDVIRLIDEKGMLTEELKESIMKCTKLVEVEDLYSPYKDVEYYEYNVDVTDNKLTSTVDINYAKVDTDKLLEIDSANGQLIKDGKISVDDIKSVYESLGATCKND